MVKGWCALQSRNRDDVCTSLAAPQHHALNSGSWIMNAWAIGRDPENWDAPDDFVPERDFKGMDSEFIPFGAGRRICPGMVFGLANIELVLAALLFHFDWRMPEGMVAEEVG
ncbi:hypothetical protein PR202_gb06456 [Eleusine coracana subsp. coracana]|uniref:Uncharacterized protein n=1 Tax=Eleusine coracana subsp. coracana TaxID=191504 RepID=A0AAV5E7W4_ELECO|nr:hypothetical protein PR202_gb06456 [Eleusine coracana subsp. coracana]